MEKKMETTIVYRDSIGIMEKKIETTVVCWDSTGRMEKKMETTIRVCWDSLATNAEQGFDMLLHGNPCSSAEAACAATEKRDLQPLLRQRHP